MIMGFLALGIYAFYGHQARWRVDALVALRRGASGEVLRRRSRYGSSKGRRARRLLQSAEQVYRARRPCGFVWARRGVSSPGPLASYVAEHDYLTIDELSRRRPEA